MTNKKSFVLYNDYRKHIELLDNEERGQLLMALFDFADGKAAPQLDRAVQMAFSFIAAQMERDNEKYESKREALSANGAKGGRPPKTSKKSNCFPEEADESKKSLTDIVSDIETYTDTVTVSRNEAEAWRAMPDNRPTKPDQNSRSLPERSVGEGLKSEAWRAMPDNRPTKPDQNSRSLPETDDALERAKWYWEKIRRESG